MTRNIARFRKRLPKVDRREWVANSRRLVHEGSVRHLLVKTRAGDTVIEVPLAAGVVGAAMAPRWAVVGTLAALATNCSISVERH